jgi:AcrR family transcriptional regulator
MLTFGNLPLITVAAQAQATPTRERILAAALELFAERGFEATSTAEIESAAGLAPRSGALYRHFPSKVALLEEALAQRMREIDSQRERLEVGPLGDLRAELTLIARWGMAELDREKALARIVMKEGHRLPRVVAGFRESIVRRGHALAVDVLRRHADVSGAQLGDLEATASVLCSALVGFHLQELMVGRDSVGIDEERFVAAWVDAAVTVAENAERRDSA